MAIITATSKIKSEVNITDETDMSLYHPCKNHGCKPVIFRVKWGRNVDTIARCPEDKTDEEAVFDGSVYKWNKFNPLKTFPERLRHHVQELKRVGIT